MRTHIITHRSRTGANVLALLALSSAALLGAPAVNAQSLLFQTHPIADEYGWYSLTGSYSMYQGFHLGAGSHITELRLRFIGLDSQLWPSPVNRAANDEYPGRLAYRVFSAAGFSVTANAIRPGNALVSDASSPIVTTLTQLRSPTSLYAASIASDFTLAAGDYFFQLADDGQHGGSFPAWEFGTFSGPTSPLYYSDGVNAGLRPSDEASLQLYGSEVPVDATPEPATLVLVASGLGLATLSRRLQSTPASQRRSPACSLPPV